jgi:hypothetical protein
LLPGVPWSGVIPGLFYNRKNCNESLCPLEWRFLISRFMTYVDCKMPCLE